MISASWRRWQSGCADGAKTSLPVPVVYTMGKVGSSAISGAFHTVGLRCYDIHTLERQRLKARAAVALAENRLPPRHICEAMAYRNGLFSEPGRCLFITLVRDPLERNLSAFFENRRHAAPEIRDETDPARLAALFLDRYDQDMPLTWFAREFGTQLGIDIGGIAFDPFVRWVRSNNVIVMRTDCPDSEKSRVLSEAMGRRIKIGRRNSASDKGYAALYHAVQARLAPSSDLLDRLYGSAMVRQFWSPEETQALHHRWKAPSQDPPFTRARRHPRGG